MWTALRGVVAMVAWADPPTLGLRNPVEKSGVLGSTNARVNCGPRPYPHNMVDRRIAGRVVKCILHKMKVTSPPRLDSNCELLKHTTNERHCKHGASFLQELPCLHLNFGGLSGLALVRYVSSCARESFHG